MFVSIYIPATGAKNRKSSRNSNFLFTVAVKTCPKLSIPYYGTAICKNSDLRLLFDYTPRNISFMRLYENEELRSTESLPIDTDCKFKCGPGFYMVGSANRNCLPVSKWDGLQTNCKRIDPNFLRKASIHQK